MVYYGHFIQVRVTKLQTRSACSITSMAFKVLKHYNSAMYYLMQDVFCTRTYKNKILKNVNNK